MNWFVYALASPLFWGIENYLSKIISRRNINSRQVSALFGLTVSVFCFIASIVAGEKLNLGGRTIFLTSATAVAFFLSMIVRLKVLRDLDASMVYPLHKIINLATLVAISFYFLKEPASVNQMLGMVLLVPSIYLLSDSGCGRIRFLFLPIVLTALSAILAGISNYTADVASKTVTVFTFGGLTYFWGFIFSWVLSLWQGNSGESEQKLFRKKEFVWLVLVMSGFNFLGFVCFYLALSAGPLAIVGAASNLSLVVTLVLSFLYLREKLDWQKIGGIVFAFISLFLLK